MKVGVGWKEVEENTMVMKARSGKHFPRMDQSTNKRDLDFF